MDKAKNKNLTIIMYHYIRDVEKTPSPGIHALSCDRFREQLKKLKREYTIISAKDVNNAAKNNLPLPANSCMLSFDDGLKDHYENVFFLLKENNVSGIFFPITMSFEHRVADAHKIHFLLAKLGTGEMILEFNKFLKNKTTVVQEKFKISNKEKIDPRYKFDDILTANLKVTMQILPKDMKSGFIDVIFKKFLGNEKEFARNLYLSETEIREMSDAGMVFGSHTHTHSRLDQLPQDKQQEELRLSKKILENITKTSINIISYPYGIYNSDTIAISRKLGYTMRLGTNAGINEKKLEMRTLKRINCKNI